MKIFEDTHKEYSAIVDKLSDLSQGNVLVIGDVMIDTYLIGDSTRISPEAPVPVVKIEETRNLLGGAGNVARAITNLGGKATIIGLVGDDIHAKEMHKLFMQDAVHTHLLSSPSRNTTVKTRVLARKQQMLRMDTETCLPLTEEEHKEVYRILEKELEKHDVVIISDYAKGFVTKGLTDFLRAYAKKNTHLKIIADPKPENKYLYKDFYLLTPNLKETSELANSTLHSLESVATAAKALRAELGLNFLLTTLGSDGMALISENDEIIHIPTSARQVFDVTGAGDTVIASIALALSVGFSELEACLLANCAAGIVVAKVGSATASQEEIIAAVQSNR